MKTLRDERARLFGPSHPANETYSPAVGPHFDMEHRFFAKYGSWRVGEGELVWAGVYRGEQMKRLRDRVCVEVSDESGSHYVHIGRIGDNVKFILPPEEHRLPDVTGEQYVWAVRRAEKYEQALREIAAVGSPFEAPHRDDACWVAAERFRIAREALNDTDS